MEIIPGAYLILCKKTNSQELMDKLQELNVNVRRRSSFSGNEAINIENVSDETFSQIKDLKIVENWERSTLLKLSF